MSRLLPLLPSSWMRASAIRPQAHRWKRRRYVRMGSCWQRTPADRAQKDGLTGNVREAAEVFRVRRLVPLEWARGGAGNGVLNQRRQACAVRVLQTLPRNTLNGNDSRE